MNSPLGNSKVRKMAYTFELALDEVRIKVRFPCRISVNWNYGKSGATQDRERPGPPAASP